jgi:hypothetical protein
MTKVTFTYRPPKGLASERVIDEAALDKVPPTAAKPSVMAARPALKAASGPKAAPVAKPLPVPKPVLEPVDLEVSELALVDKWWYESSFDLRSGLDVIEDTTVPGDLWEDLLSPRKTRRAR